MRYNLNLSTFRRIRDFGDLRTRKKCHPAGSGQLLSYASSQRYVTVFLKEDKHIRDLFKAFNIIFMIVRETCARIETDLRDSH